MRLEISPLSGVGGSEAKRKGPGQRVEATVEIVVILGGVFGLAEVEEAVAGAPADPRRDTADPAGPEIHQLLIQVDGGSLLFTRIQVVVAEALRRHPDHPGLGSREFPGGTQHRHGHLLPVKVLRLVTEAEIEVGVSNPGKEQPMGPRARWAEDTSVLRLEQVKAGIGLGGGARRKAPFVEIDGLLEGL